jgi:putative tricarboxylic transport membrane protein
VVQGLQPGPMLFQEHPEVVYPIFGAMMLANIAMLTIGLLSVRVIARIILVDKRVLLPTICVLSVIGAYALQFSMFDVWVAITMGAVGYGMKRYGFPASPVVLAMILGPMAERNLRQALLFPDASSLMFLTRPITAVLLILAISAITIGLFRRPSLNVESE